MKKVTFKHWLLFGGVVVLAGLIAARVMAQDRCPVDLPPEYRFVEYQPRASAAVLALNDRNGIKDNGTSASWLFVAEGSVEDAKDRVLRFLNQTGRWTQIHSRSFVVFSRDGKSPEVVLMRARRSDGSTDPRFHRIRVNGPWETSGGTERALALLPKSWLEKIAQDK